MEQHPVPQNIATFEFKLFGNLTVRQFITLLIPMTLAAVIFFSNALSPIIRVFIAGMIGFIGFIIAVVPFNGRPFDKWVVSFIKALLAPTVRIWVKEKKIPEFLTIVTTPVVIKHETPQGPTTESKERLLAYLRSLPGKKESPLDIREKVAVERLALDKITPQEGKLPPTIIWKEEPATPPAKKRPPATLSPQILQHAESGKEPKFITKKPQAAIFRTRSAHFTQKTKPEPTPQPVPQPQKAPPEIIKISSYAKPYILPGIERKLAETKFAHARVFEPIKAHLASETNYVIQNIIPIQTSKNEMRLIPSIGQIRVRKLHFAPPPNFDLSKLPVRGEKSLDVSDELKKRFANSEQSLLNAFSEQVPKPIINPNQKPVFKPQQTQKSAT